MVRSRDLTDNAIVLLVFLYVRGVLLWAIVPAGVVLWVAARVVAPRRNRGIGPRMTIGWVDHNVSVVLSRLLPTMSSEPLRGWSRIRE